MWRTVLSWVALVANVLAVIIDVGFMVYAWFAEGSGGPASVDRLIGVLVVGGFLVGGPAISIFAVLVGAPLMRRDPRPQTAAMFE